MPRVTDILCGHGYPVEHSNGLHPVSVLTADTPEHASTLARVGDEALTHLAAQDTRAFTELYRRYVPRVYRYLLARCGDPEDTQELTADTFLAAAQNLARFRRESQFSTWLLGIARHKLADYFRRRQPTVPFDALSELAAPDWGADEALTRKLRLERLRRALPGLAAERAEAIGLHFFAGLTIPEVAQLMQKNEAAVRMLIHRGVRDLRARLATYRAEADHEAF